MAAREAVDSGLMPRTKPSKLRLILAVLVIFAAWWWFNHPQRGAMPDRPVATARSELPAPQPLPPLLLLLLLSCILPSNLKLL